MSGDSLRTHDFAQVYIDGDLFHLVIPEQEETIMLEIKSIASLLTVMANWGWEYIGANNLASYLFKRPRNDT